MATIDICAELTRLLDDEAARLEELRNLMASERAAFVALRPSERQAGTDRIATTAQASSEIAARRDDLVAELARSLGRSTDVGLRELLGLLPQRGRDDLRRAAERATEAAMRVRIEVRVGERLLDFSRQSNELLVRAMHGVDDDRSGVYDRNARRVSDRSGNGPGLLSGTV